ncbi:MAG TPA: HEAT repeat domain-containing protein [Vicinamibacteria bacterium]
MIDPVSLGIVATIGLVGLGVQRAVAAARGRAWKHAAELAQLTEVQVKKTAGLVTRVSGKAGELSARIESFAHGKHSRGTRVVVSGLGHGKDELAIRREGLGTALGKAIGRGEMELGDALFDQAVYLQGSPELAAAVLDAETRECLRHLMWGRYYSPSERMVDLGGGTRAWLADGELCLELGRSEQAILGLPALLAIAERLKRPADLGARLAENLIREAHPGARLSVVKALLAGHHKHPMARPALLKAAREDTSTEVRLRAALALGTEGWDTLTQIAFDKNAGDDECARAVAGLGWQLTMERAQALMESSLRAGRLETAAACVANLGTRRGPEVAAILTRVLQQQESTLGVAAVRGLAQTREDTVEPVLIDALQAALAEVRLAAAEALGRVGTVAAVMPLRQASEREGAGELHGVARQAIASIHTRVKGAAPGQLSLAGGELGQVSLVEGDEARGRLTAPEGGEP